MLITIYIYIYIHTQTLYDGYCKWSYRVNSFIFCCRWLHSWGRKFWILDVFIENIRRCQSIENIRRCQSISTDTSLKKKKKKTNMIIDFVKLGVGTTKALSLSLSLSHEHLNYFSLICSSYANNCIILITLFIFNFDICYHCYSNLPP